MNFSGVILGRIFSRLVALHSFFFNRPRLDVVIRPDKINPHGKKVIRISAQQDVPQPIQVGLEKWDQEFFWNYIIKIKNNSSKSAYNIKIEKITESNDDYNEKPDIIDDLKGGEVKEMKYIVRYQASMTGQQAMRSMSAFPMHIDKIEIVISFTNEARKKFYSSYVFSPNSEIIEHHLCRPKELKRKANSSEI